LIGLQTTALTMSKASGEGEICAAFEEAFKELTAQDKYKGCCHSARKLHDGYFAADKKGVFKRHERKQQADDDVYSLIMKRKRTC